MMVSLLTKTQNHIYFFTEIKLVTTALSEVSEVHHSALWFTNQWFSQKVFHNVYYSVS